MINKQKLGQLVEQYKRVFDERWASEGFKWDAVATFQRNWDVDATDFEGMLEKALEDANKLLIGRYFMPGDMINIFAQHYPEQVRAMFRGLFDEKQDLIERLAEFKNQAENLLVDFAKQDPKAKSTYQNEGTMMTYLWLKYPSKYFFYRYGQSKHVADILESDYQFKPGKYDLDINNALSLDNEIAEFLRQDPELRTMLADKLGANSYTDENMHVLTSDFVFFLQHDLNEADEPEVTEEEILEPVKIASYTKSDFLDEVYISADKFDRMQNVLKHKKNIILQGAPGVGKTFAAKRLAYAMMGEQDDDRIASVQFHQNYSYEDFMMGYKPTGDGFALKTGVFYDFCKKAAADPERDYFFIIDEINRGNLSKIFGELLMLIESNYREKPITLAYNGEEFTIPSRLYIIGMMNTADRSLAMIDYALRRRFSFISMEPAFDNPRFVAYEKTLQSATLDRLIDVIKSLNNDIRSDKTLGSGFCIGHSYFCQLDPADDLTLKNIVDYDIIPMLEEYWFDDEEKVREWADQLHGVFA
ncbi:MAG: AAA family ATPase [Limosilactobacillus sp.]|uniref:AAA family ATPase n=1 Tax=Limosilactobacillus sp. TaxID=2773925 RepID=UPI002711C217|nr:AAA family ATPase [Limosilactobacillus sp.]